MLDAVDSERLTPVSTVIDAYLDFLDHDDLYGQAVECSVERRIVVPPPPFLNGECSRRANIVWEPGFVSKHSEMSGLDDTLG